MDAARWGLFFAASVVVSAGAVALLARVAPAVGLVDIPGGRKAHDHEVPLVGGIAVFIALLVCSSAAGIATDTGAFLIALSIIIAIGCWDDVAELSPRLKFAIQIAASAIMIWGAGVELRSVGDLLGWRSIGLSIFSVPLTIFAIGRTIGWIGHAIEQYATAQLIRPRAKYVGVMPIL